MIKDFIKGKKFFITGGTGTLGKALTSRILDNGGSVVIYSRDEGKQANLFSQNKKIRCIIGDIRDYKKLSVSVFREMPDVILHTAALKRIDDMELEPDECIKTNIYVSENVARAALENNISKCILISTDKACKPVNVYGSSKLIAERIFTNYDFHSRQTIFSSVRYGNVICSRGSFIPLWLKLLSEGKNIKVTSLEMSTLLFTIQDAVDTVLYSVINSEGGEVFIPNISSYDMRTIIKAVEKIHDSKVEFDLVGLRPGEKLHEDMLAETELPFTYKVDDLNLLCVRPQYTKRKHNKYWSKYTGPHFNSSIHVSNDANVLKDLIKRGEEESN